MTRRRGFGYQRAAVPTGPHRIVEPRMRPNIDFSDLWSPKMLATMPMTKTPRATGCFGPAKWEW